MYQYTSVNDIHANVNGYDYMDILECIYKYIYTKTHTQ